MKFNIQISFFIFSFSFFSCTSLTMLEKKSTKEYYKVPVKTTDDFIWGINGHPITHLDYTMGSIGKQLELLKEHQLDYYRVDITTNDDGSINTYPDKFSELLEKSSQYQIKILPIIKFDIQIRDYNINIEKAYELGNSQMSGFIKRYGRHFEYYELGNEQENKILYENLNGMLTTDYDYQKFEILASYFKGMKDAIKQLQPEAKTMTSASWLHLGYFDLLKSAGIDFDIISYHWYSNMGSMFNSNYENVNIIHMLTKKYNKPIWITELNKKDGSIHNSEEQQAFWVNYFIDELDHQSNIQALFVYELHDEPNLKDQDWIAEGEAYYGIVKWKNTPLQSSDIVYKLVSEVLKFRIEEIKYGNDDLLYSALQNILNKELSDSIFNQWKEKFQTNKNLELTLKEMINDLGYKSFNEQEVIISKEKTEKIIQVYYESLFQRKPYKSELRYWRRKLKKNVTPENMTLQLILSEEYWENAVWLGYERRTGFKRP